MTELYLRNNYISSVELHVFDESANLPSLHSIDLSGNQLTELEPWPFILGQHKEMIIYLRSNRIKNFTNALRWSFSCNSRTVRVKKLDLIDNDINHITDMVHGWNIDGKLPCDYIGYWHQIVNNTGNDFPP